MKIFVLIISTTFPSTHKRKGEKTYFEDKILKRYSEFNEFIDWIKIHTIRKNYKYWVNRIKQIQEGKAILSIRFWEKPGGCYVKGNKQIEVCQLDKDSGIGVQKIAFLHEYCLNPILVDENDICTGLKVKELSKNDGLSLEDFKEWFRKYDLSSPLAIIHFTKFRY